MTTVTAQALRKLRQKSLEGTQLLCSNITYRPSYSWNCSTTFFYKYENWEI